SSLLVRRRPGSERTAQLYDSGGVEILLIRFSLAWAPVSTVGPSPGATGPAGDWRIFSTRRALARNRCRTSTASGALRPACATLRHVRHRSPLRAQQAAREWSRDPAVPPQSRIKWTETSFRCPFDTTARRPPARQAAAYDPAARQSIPRCPGS